MVFAMMVEEGNLRRKGLVLHHQKYCFAFTPSRCVIPHDEFTRLPDITRKNMKLHIRNIISNSCNLEIVTVNLVRSQMFDY
jgi:hypothetical protein